MDKQLRVIIVGCGYFGQKRIQACQRHKDLFRIVGVVDTDTARAASFAVPLGIPHANSISAVLRATPADVAIIATPNCYHAPLACEALRHKLHVLCEKPLASSFSEAKKIVRSAKKYGRLVKAGSNHRFFPTIQKAAELIANGDIGEILYIKGDIGNNGSHTKESWFWNDAISGGGTYIDNACHLLDIIRWFMGDFVSCVGAMSNVYWKKTRVEDVAGGIYKTKKGRLAVITSSWTQWTGYMSLEIWGSKGYILIDSKRGSTTTVGSTTDATQRVFDFSNQPLSSYDDELSYFAQCIHHKSEPRPNAIDGARVIQMIEGVYRSAKQGKRVQLSSSI